MDNLKRSGAAFVIVHPAVLRPAVWQPMKSPRSRSRSTSRSPAKSTTPLDQQAIDQRYGLEPVFEPQGSTSASADGGTQFTTVQCPYCGEPFDTAVDLSAGSTSYIEDCQVCCRPIEMGIEIGANGELGSVDARRTD
jgi:hypothetical protein